MPELLVPPPTSHLVVQRSIFRPGAREVLEVRPGLTIAEILAVGGLVARADLVVFVDDLSVPQARWTEFVPRPGATVAAVVVPRGAEGESTGKSVLRVVALLAVVALTIFTFGTFAPVGAGLTGQILAGVAAAAVGIAGQLAVNALLPPPQPIDGQQPDTKGQNFITSTRNEIRRMQPVPRPYGTIRFAPPMGALPYTVWKKGKAHFRQVFVCRGPNDLADLRIGPNPLFKEGTTLSYTGKMTGDGAFKDVTLELRRGYDNDAAITLYDQEVHEDGFQIELEAKKEGSGSDGVDKVAVVRRTLTDTEEISVDVACPAGLSYQHKDGSSTTFTLEVRVRYRAVGASQWIAPKGDDGKELGDIVITANTIDFVRRGQTWIVPKGQYDVEVARKTPKAGDDGITDKLYWIKLTSHRKGQPFTMTGLTVVAMDILATGQLNGYVDEFTALYTSRLKDWNANEEAGGNHALVLFDILTGKANRLAISEADWTAKLDLDGLQAWRESIETDKRKFCGVFDDVGTVFKRCQAVAASARASFAVRDGKYGVIRDTLQTVPVGGHFTPRNSWGFHEHGVYEEVPHAIKVRFPNPALDFKLDEQYVYADGYSKDGAGGTIVATVFETLDYPYSATGSEVWRDTRYHLAVLRERPAMYERMTDFEWLRAQRGDLIACADDVIAVGIAQGRIKAIATTNPDGTGDVVSITLDQVCTMEVGKTYGVRMRRSDMTSVVKVVNTVAGEQTTLTFATAISNAAEKPGIQDLVLFGESGQEAGLYLLKEVIPGPNFTAKIVYLDRGPATGAVYDADAVTVPRPEWARDRVAGEVEENTRAPTSTVLEAPTIEHISSGYEPPASGSSSGGSSSTSGSPPQYSGPVSYAIVDYDPPSIIVATKPKKKKHGK